MRSWFPEICGITITTGTLTVALSALAMGAASLVHRTIQKSEDRWCKVHSQDGQLPVDERVYGPISRPTARRTMIYSLVLLIAFCEFIVAGITTFAGGYWSEYFPTFSWVSSGVSLLTWIWAAILLSNNRRPSSKRGLTRAAAHFYSACILSIVWFGIGVLWSTETHEQCTVLSARMARQFPPVKFNVFSENVRCPLSVANLAVAFTIFSLMMGVAHYILRIIRKAGGLLGGSNIARFDGDLVEATEESHMVPEAGPETGVAVGLVEPLLIFLGANVLGGDTLVYVHALLDF
ncbi:hypothetical protein PQX77_017516 [Marasmius sp. AFHP31]|nr:hypothetical protein PQX77_017516 [Marasmius sp. AFHP31]